MKRTTLLLVLLFTVLTLSSCSADSSGTSGFNFPKVYVSEHVSLDFTKTEAAGSGGLLFLSASGTISGELSGTIYAINSDITVSSSFSGEIILLMSDVKITGDGVFTGTITTLSSEVIIEKTRGEVEILPLFGIFDFFSKTTQEGAWFKTSDKIPLQLFLAIYMLAGLFFAGIILTLRPAVFEQCAANGRIKWQETIFTGLAAYILFVGFMALLAYSVILIPVAVVVFVLMYFLVFLGKIAVGLIMGSLILKRFKLNTNALVCMVIGSGLLGLLRMIPVVGLFSVLCIVPVFSLGAIFSGGYRSFVAKDYIAAEEVLYTRKKSDNISEIRDIIRANRGSK